MLVQKISWYLGTRCDVPFTLPQPSICNYVVVTITMVLQCVMWQMVFLSLSHILEVPHDILYNANIKHGLLQKDFYDILQYSDVCGNQKSYIIIVESAQLMNSSSNDFNFTDSRYSCLHTVCAILDQTHIPYVQ